LIFEKFLLGREFRRIGKVFIFGLAYVIMNIGIKIVLGIFGFLFFLGLIGSMIEEPETVYITGDAVSDDETDDSEIEKVSNEKIEILEHELVYGEYGNLMVQGVAKNTAGKKLAYAEIDVKFYDKEGILIGTSLDNINNIEDGEKWRFEVMYFDMDTSDVDSYKISIGTIW
jgi:hypothetical protein